MKLFLQSNKPTKPRLSSKTKQIMRLTSVLFISLAFQMSASVSSQNVTFKGSNLSARKVLSVLKAQTDYVFFYEREILNDFQPVNLNLQNASIETALKSAFANEAISWNIVDKTVFLATKKELPAVKLEVLQIIIKGTVTNEKGEPIPGANVLAKGSTVAVQTDADGNFSINVSNNVTKLVVSFVGMESQEVIIGKNPLIIVLKEQGQKLEEVVISVAYGKSSKKKLVSAIATIDTKEIANAPYTSVVNGLAGRAAGLFVQESGGEYGSLASISIRGGGEPAYYVDGIKASKGEFSRIAASDIENISVLKDAAATALYGFDAANGVVLVTTKRGDNQKIKFSYSGNYAFVTPSLEPKYLTAYEKAIYKNKVYFNDGLPAVYDAEMLNILKNNLDPIAHPNTNAYKELIKPSSAQLAHNLSMNGTVNNTRVFMSLDYFSQDGIFKTGSDLGFKRYAYRSNISHKFEDIGLLVEGNMTLQHSLKVTPPRGSSNILSHVRNWNPGDPFYNPEGNYYGQENPLSEADDRAGYQNDEVNFVKGGLSLGWDVKGVKGLKLSTRGNYVYDSSFYKYFSANQRNAAPSYTWANLLENSGKANINQSTARSLSYNLEAQIDYKNTFFDKHTVELTGVYVQNEANGDNFSASRRDFSSPAVDQLFAGSSVGKDNNGNGYESGSIGYIGRLKYDFNSKYVLEANFRYDGYDGFAPGAKFALFPSVSLGWNVDREEFIKPLMEVVGLSSLKFRASIGKIGSAFGRFSYLSVYNLQNNNYYIGGEYVTGFSEGGLTPSNDAATWTTTESKNVGVDFGFMNNKLTGSFDAFYYRTTGYLGSPASIYTTPLGQGLPQINTDSAFRRGGVELGLNYKTNIDDVKLNIGGNVSYYDQLWEKNANESLTDLKNPYKRSTQQVDYYTNGYISQGLYQSYDQMINSPRRLGATQMYLGDIVYQDFNGDGRLDGDDQVRIGKGSFPHITYGANLNAEYKGFSLAVLFQGTSNRQMYLGDIYRNGINQKNYVIQTDSWTPDNTDALFPRASSFDSVNGSNNIAGSDFWLKDAWYLRLKSLSLSYDLKNFFLKDYKGISNCALSFSGTNLFTISPLNKFYLDPETSSDNNYGYPVGKTFNIGLRTTF